jgi:hypothetical protein
MTKEMTVTTFDFAALNSTPRAIEFEQQLPNLKFYQLDWGQYVPVVEGFDPDEVPAFTKAIKDVERAQGFWRGLIESLVGKARGNLARAGADQCALSGFIQDDVDSVMMFVSGSAKNEQVDKLGLILSGILTDWDVKVVNGGHTSNAKAETDVKQWIEIAKDQGKRGVWLLSTNMATRSFSVSDINVVLLAYDAGDQAATIQKISRALTPGGGKGTGHVVSLSLVSGRDDKTDAIVLEAAEKVAESQDLDLEEAVRRVYRTMPIFTIDDGYSVQLDVSDYLNRVLSLRGCKRVAVGREAILLHAEDIQALVTNVGKMGNRLDRPEVKLTPGTTFKDPANRQGTREATLSASDLNNIRQRLEALADQSEYFVYFSGLKPSIQSLFETLENDEDLTLDFYEEFRVAPENLKELFELKALNRVAVEAAMSLHLTNR